MRLIKRYCLTCIFLCVAFFHDANSQETVKTGIINADSLFNAENYFEAAIEYERLYFFSDTPESRILANLKKAEALKRQGRFMEAKTDLQRSAQMMRFPEHHSRVLYQIAVCDYLSDNPNGAISILKQLEMVYPEYAKNEDVTLLYALSATTAENLFIAKEKTISLLLLQNLEQSITDSIKSEIEYLFSDILNSELRSERKASLLSTFIPGSGHFYAGYPGKGVLNAFSQLASLAAAAVLFYNKYYFSGFIAGFGMFQSFYLGGIKQAAKLARTKNGVLTQDVYDRRVSLILGLPKHKFNH